MPTPPTPEMLSAAFGDCCARLGIREPGESVLPQVLHSIREPVDRFRQAPNWPSALNDSGLPVEFSLKLEGPGSVALRYVVDVTDHSFGPAGNWQRYVDHGIACTGCRTPEQADVVWDLCRTHLDGVPAAYPSRLVHGAGFGTGDRSRGSLYFRTGWLDEAELGRRLPAQVALAETVRTRYASPVPGGIEVMGYDFTDGELTRAKMYTWLPVRPDLPFAVAAGDHPELGAAGELYARFARAVPEPAREHALFLQSSAAGDDVAQRLFFFADAWGWTAPGGLRALLGAAGELGVDLRPLLTFQRALSDHGVRMRLSMVAVAGAVTDPSVTFYFLPLNDAVGHPADDGPDVDRMYRTATAHLLARRGAAGNWGDLRLTASVAAALSPDPALRPALATTAEWLAAELAHRRDDAEVTALAAQVPLPTALRPAAEEALRALAGQPATLDAESAAAGLVAVVGADGLEDLLPSLLRAVLDGQRADGLWPRGRCSSELLATGRSLAALMAVPQGALRDEAPRVRRAIELGVGAVGRTLVPRDPFRLALWLHAWLAGGGSLRNATVTRILAALADLQCPDGRWRGVPVRATGLGDDVDTTGLLTTATVVEALHALMLRLGR